MVGRVLGTPSPKNMIQTNTKQKLNRDGFEPYQPYQDSTIPAKSELNVGDYVKVIKISENDI